MLWDRSRGSGIDKLIEQRDIKGLVRLLASDGSAATARAAAGALSDLGAPACIPLLADALVEQKQGSRRDRIANLLIQLGRTSLCGSSR